MRRMKLNLQIRGCNAGISPDLVNSAKILTDSLLTCELETGTLYLPFFKILIVSEPLNLVPSVSLPVMVRCTEPSKSFVRFKNS